VVLRTANGGATWTDLVLPPTFVQLDAVSCPTPTVCLAVGGDANGTGAVWRTTDAGVTWAPARVPASVGEVVAVACVSATRCEAVGYLLNSWTAVLASTDGGATWAALPMPHTATDLHAIACPVVARCVAVGGHGGTAVAFYSTTAGRTWRPAHLTGGLRPFDAVACVSALVCLAASEQHAGSASQGTVERTTDGGVTWAPVVVPAHVASVASIACAGPSRCVAVGQTRAAIDPAASAAISIATATAGRSWTIVPAPRRVWGLDAVACARGGACVAAGTGTYEPPLPPTGAVVLRLG
jgi:photosystem II stability/assembly factor-like uncharacterized protein